MTLKEKIKVLFTKRLWTVDSSGESKVFAFFVRFFKLIHITFDTFAQNRMGFQCVSLSYFITLALVPLIAVAFVVTGGLGLTNRLLELLYQSFPGNPELIDFVMDKANNIIDAAKGGGVGLLSFLLFIWAILWMMFQVERVFNNVWGIRKIPRKIYKRFGFYFLVIFLSPFIVMLFGTGIAYYTNLTRLIGLDLSDIKFLPKIIGYTVFYVIAVFTMSVMYKYIPAAKIKYSNALKAALVAGIVFVLFQYLYLETQVFVGRLNKAYGVIAAIPLFLIWLNFSWQIIIYGAEFTYSLETIDTYNVPGWDSDIKE